MKSNLTSNAPTKSEISRAACRRGLIILAVIEPSLGALLIFGNLSQEQVWCGFLLIVAVFVAVVLTVTTILLMPEKRNRK